MNRTRSRTFLASLRFKFSPCALCPLWLCLCFLFLSFPLFASPPNFIIILADDLGWGDLGCYGAKSIATPHLDRMAAEGMRFTNFYSSANVCTPSRAGLLTGRYSARMGLAKDVLYAASPGGLPEDEVTIAEALKPAGYAAIAIGKWHLGKAPPHWPTHAGFDAFFGAAYSNDMNPFALYRGEEKIEEPVEQRTLTERYTDEAIAFAKANRERPFFIYLAHNMPHIPLYATAKHEGKSKGGLYGDVVEELDANVGRLLAAIRELGLDERTLVSFTSDNGPWFEGSPGPFRGRKGDCGEGGMRVPMIARWPGKIAPGSVCDEPAMNIDFLPTLAGLAEALLPEGRTLDGADISPLLFGGAAPAREALYLFQNEKIAAVRSGKWKLVLRGFYRKFEPDFGTNAFYKPGILIDLENDPGENLNVAREHPEVLARLVALAKRAEAEIIPPAP